MLLYAMNTRHFPCWCLDLAFPVAGIPSSAGGSGQSDKDLPSVYALMVPLPAPGRLYIGSTCWLRRRVQHHLSRSRTDLARTRAGAKTQTPKNQQAQSRTSGQASGRALRNSASRILEPVLAARCALLVVRLEALPGADQATLKRHELAWLLVAAREALPVTRRRGPSIEWKGDADEMRAAFRLARRRCWPGPWLAALRPLCLNRALPQRPPLAHKVPRRIEARRTTS
jgi:hypothetical protein